MFISRWSRAARRRVACFLAAAALVLGAMGVYAHGGGEIKLARVPIGEYKITVWQNPPQAKAGETIHFTVGAASGEEETAVLDATITAKIIAADGQTALSLPATTEQSANQLFYETDFTLQEAGDYTVQILFSRQETNGETTFAMNVTEPTGISWLWIGLIGLILIVALGLWRAQKRVTIDSNQSLPS